MFYLPQIKAIKPISTHITGAKMLQFVFRTEADTARKFLPPPLKLDGEPSASAYIADFARTDFSSPAYREAALFLRARYGDRTGNYCLAMYVDDDVAMIRGREIYGFPKKMARLDFEKKGSVIKGTVKRKGSVIMNAEAEIGEKYGSGNSAFGENTFNFKYFIAPECQGYDYNPRLVNVRISETINNIRDCRGNLAFGSSKADPLHKIPLTEILSVRYSEGDMELPPGEVLAETDPESFTPYAFFRLK